MELNPLISKNSQNISSSYNLDSFSHMFLSVTNAKQLDNFTMRSLYFQLKLHPSIAPITSRSVWCHKSEVFFDDSFMIPLQSLAKIHLNELDISLDFFSKQLLAVKHIGSVKLPLESATVFNRNQKQILFFYKQSIQPIFSTEPEENTILHNESYQKYDDSSNYAEENTETSLIKTENPKIIGRVTCTLAFGFEDHKNFIEPPLLFNLASVQYIKKKKVPKIDVQTANLKERTITYVEENWDTFVKLNCILESPDSPKANNSHEIHSPNTHFSQKSFAQSEIITIEPSSPSTPNTPSTSDRYSHSTHLQLFESPVKEISRTQPILSPCLTPVNEINSILDEDLDTEKRIDSFIERKMMQGFGSLAPHPRVRDQHRRVSRTPPKSFQSKQNNQNRWSTPPSTPASQLIRTIEKSPSLEKILDGEDKSFDILLSDSSESSENERFTRSNGRKKHII